MYARDLDGNLIQCRLCDIRGGLSHRFNGCEIAYEIEVFFTATVRVDDGLSWREILQGTSMYFRNLYEKLIQCGVCEIRGGV